MEPSVNVRRIALYTLERVLDEGAYSALALNAAIKEHHLSARDASFLSALTYGVLERLLLLDHVIRQYSSLRIGKIEPRTLMILRLGIYQLLYMDRVPDSAAVNESVKLCKKCGMFKSAGFVNGLLRSFLRAEKQFSLPDALPQRLSVQYSCPQGVVSMWLSSYGEELTERLLQELIGRPPLTIRVNTLKTSVDKLTEQLQSHDIEVERVPYLPYALNLSHTGSLEELDAFERGLFYVEDGSSQLCCEMLGAMPHETVCDICAAPGGKSFYSAMLMGDTGTVYAYDIHKHKVRLIESSAARLGITAIHAAVRDAADDTAVLPRCDRILCDVPCSGLGILRRKPEIRYKKDTFIDILPKLQYSILCINADFAPIGGTVVYSTCTLRDEENRAVVDRFLSEHPAFIGEELTLPQGLGRAVDEPPHMLTVLPTMFGSDGFFIAKFRRIR